MSSQGRHCPFASPRAGSGSQGTQQLDRHLHRRWGCSPKPSSWQTASWAPLPDGQPLSSLEDPEPGTGYGRAGDGPSLRQAPGTPSPLPGLRGCMGGGGGGCLPGTASDPGSSPQLGSPRRGPTSTAPPSWTLRDHRPPSPVPRTAPTDGRLARTVWPLTQSQQKAQPRWRRAQICP